MAREKKMSVFVVMVENPNGSRFPYYEDARTAQEAVDSVRCYKDDCENIVFVFKQVENWK